VVDDQPDVAPAVVDDLGDHVHVVDTVLAGHHGLTSAYLIAGSAPCLVETGTSTSAATVVAALHDLGLQPDDLATIVVTHIHLDHAGGVGELARAFPRATVAVHPAGARHLVDPTRLLAGTRAVFGPEVMERVIGTLQPTEVARIVSLADGDRIELGDGRSLTAVDSPGHARHHLALLDSLTGDLYVGDAAGLWFADTEEVRPATPPPDFDLVAALDSLGRFGDLGATRLLFTHYGPAVDVPLTLQRAADELRAWVADVAALRAAGPPAAGDPARASAPGGTAHDLDHAVAAVLDRDRRRYAYARRDPEHAAAVALLSSPEANTRGVWEWLTRSETPVYGFPAE
jgi:glyoxylase-like metal-dependent hydrolase (beta-lactamase superfamily II)